MENIDLTLLLEGENMVIFNKLSQKHEENQFI